MPSKPPTTRPAPLATSTVVVAMPPGTPTTDLLPIAAARVTAAGLAVAGGVPYFLARSRGARRLLDHWQGLTTGGPVDRLDLAGMRQRAVAAAATQWQWWRYVVASTPVARSWDELWDRAVQNPDRYPPRQVLREFVGQPRIAAMRTHNAMPGQRWPLPPADVEMFQAGHRTYCGLAWLAAVPGDGFVCPGGPLLQPGSDRLSDRITYLRHANAHLERLARGTALVAVLVRGAFRSLDV